MYLNLEVTRKTRGYTINDMAFVISKSPATYYKKEMGFVSTTVKEAIQIAKKLNSTVEYLFTE